MAALAFLQGLTERQPLALAAAAVVATTARQLERVKLVVPMAQTQQDRHQQPQQ
jgi:hypothetical protein